MSAKNHRSSGFTLIELLVAMALASILIGVIAFTFQQTRAVQNLTEARVEGARAVQGAFDDMEEDLRRVLPTTIVGLRFRAQRLDQATTIRADLLEFVSETRVNGELRPARIRYVLGSGDPPTLSNPPRLFRRVEALVPAGGTFTIDPATPATEEVLVDFLESFAIRILPRGGQDFVDPDVQNGATDDGTAFVVSGADGEIRLQNGKSTLVSVSEQARLALLAPGDRVTLVPPNPLPPGFAAGPYSVSRTTANEVFLSETPPPTVGVNFETTLYPRGIQIEVRLRGRLGSASLIREFRVGGTGS